MKTAISLPDKLFNHAEKVAKEEGLSRSELYAKALAHYIEQNQREGITERINAVYEKGDSAYGTFDEKVARANVLKAEWDD